MTFALKPRAYMNLVSRRHLASRQDNQHTGRLITPLATHCITVCHRDSFNVMMSAVHIVPSALHVIMITLWGNDLIVGDPH